jgi:hypothetical protein
MGTGKDIGRSVGTGAAFGFVSDSEGPLDEGHSSGQGSLDGGRRGSSWIGTEPKNGRISRSTSHDMSRFFHLDGVAEGIEAKREIGNVAEQGVDEHVEEVIWGNDVVKCWRWLGYWGACGNDLIICFSSRISLSRRVSTGLEKEQIGERWSEERRSFEAILGQKGQILKGKVDHSVFWIKQAVGKMVKTLDAILCC